MQPLLFSPYPGPNNIYGTAEELANVATVYVTTKEIKDKWDSKLNPKPKGGVVVMTDAVRVTFSGNAGGATVNNLPNPSTVMVTKGAVLERPTKAPTRNGCTFVDWYTSASPAETDVPFAFGSTKISANMTLYAKWDLLPYTITLDKKDGSTAQVIDYNVESASTTIPNPACAGFVFDGWTGTGLSGKTKNLVVPIGSTGDRTYAANWTANTYSVVFNTNVPSGGISTGSFSGLSNLKVTADGTPTGTKTSVTLPTESSNPVKYQGHSLASSNTWTSAASATATNVKKYAGSVSLQQLVSDGLVTSGNKITLHAQWADRSYKVTYNMGDGRTGVDASVAPSAAPAGVTTAVPYSKANGFAIAADSGQKMFGYTFAGWKASVSGVSWSGGKVFSSAAISGVTSTVAPTTIQALLAPAGSSAADKVFPESGATIMLTAQWKTVPYTVNYLQDASLAHPDAAKLSAAAPGTASKTFTIENVLGKNLADDAVAKDAACVPVNNELALDGYTFGGFKGGQSAVTLSVGSVLANNAITLSDFKKMYGTESNTTGGTKVKAVDMSAQWTPWIYTITWDKGEGDAGARTDTEVKFTDAISAPIAGDASNFSKSGYSIADWQAGASGASVATAAHVYDIVYAAGAYGSAEAEGNPVTVTALWSADGKQFMVHYWFEKAGAHASDGAVKYPTGSTDASSDFVKTATKASPADAEEAKDAGIVTDAAIILTDAAWKDAYLPGNAGGDIEGASTVAGITPLGISGYKYVLDASKSAGYRVTMSAAGTNEVNVYYRLTKLNVDLAAGDKGKGSGTAAATGWNTAAADVAAQAENISAARTQAYELVGWKKTAGSPADTKLYTTEELTAHKVCDNETFTAQWSPIGYEVTYVKDDAGNVTALPTFEDMDGKPNTQRLYYTDFYDEGAGWVAKGASALPAATDIEVPDTNTKVAFGYHLAGWSGGAAGNEAMTSASFEEIFGEGDAPSRTAVLKASAAANEYTFKYYSLADKSETIAEDAVVSMDAIGAGDAAFKVPGVADVADSSKLYGYMFSSWFVMGSDPEVKASTSSAITDAAALEAFLKPVIAASGYATADIPQAGAHKATFDLSAKWVALYKVELPVEAYGISANASEKTLSAGEETSVVNASPLPVGMAAYSEIPSGDEAAKAKALFLNDVDASDSALSSALSAVKFSFAEDAGGAAFKIAGGKGSAQAFAQHVPAATSAADTGSITGAITLDLAGNDALWQNMMLSTAKLAGATDADFARYAALGITRGSLSVDWGGIAKITWVVSATDGDAIGADGTGTKEYAF